MKHKHHIIPKHMGGSNDASNIVELTIKEHAEAHRKLFEQYGLWQDKCAWLTLSGQISVAEATKMAQVNHDVSFTQTEEHKEKLRQAWIRRKASGKNLGGRKPGHTPWNKGLRYSTKSK